MRLVKTNSSKWMNDHKSSFAWQEGYGAFAVSASNQSKVVSYIHNQEAHHQKMSFEDEYLGFFGNMASNSIHALSSIEGNLPPLTGAQFPSLPYPPLTRWATTYRPCRGWDS